MCFVDDVIIDAVVVGYSDRVALSVVDYLITCLTVFHLFFVFIIN